MHAVLTPKHRITRLFNAARHPDQAALAARIPIVGQRVPARGYWRRQRIEPKRMLSRGFAALNERTTPLRGRAMDSAAAAANAARARMPHVRHRIADAGGATASMVSERLEEAGHRVSAQLPQARERAAHAGEGLATAARSTASKGSSKTRAAIARAPRNRLTIAAAAFSIGALVMYFLDRSSGRRRRARIRDRFIHIRRVLTRDVRRAAGKRSRFMQGVARGVRHDAAALIPHRYQRVDDDTLTARVRSEVLRRADVPAGDIHVDVYEGCVTLRGQLDTIAEIERVVDRTRRVDGVADVRSYLHLPGTPPPNKAESLMNGHTPAHLAR